MVNKISATSEGPNNPGTMADDNAVGTLAWANPDNAKTSNNVRSIITTPIEAGVFYSHYLEATNFGFSIPDGATIDGIVAEIEGYWETTEALFEIVRIIKGGIISGDNQVSGIVGVPEGESYTSFGWDGDLWGVEWTADNINSANFGVVLQVSQQGNEGGEFDSHVYIDHMRITIYYTPGDTCTPPDSGNWIIDGDECVLDTNDQVNGNAQIIHGGNLTLNAELKFIGANRIISIDSGSKLIMNLGGGVYG